MVPILLRVVMMITSADMVFVVLLGISFISVLAERSMIKGLISGVLGLLISLIGYQAVTGIPRFTFGTMFLYDGLGLVPGPRMLTEHLDLSLTLLLVGALTNIIAGAICFGIIPYISKIARVPARILFPLIPVIALTGTFLYRQEIGDVIIAVGFSIVGLLLRNFGYSRPALLLGFVLGTLFEKYLFISLGLMYLLSEPLAGIPLYRGLLFGD